ncbi:DNA-binding response regulator, NarL/FixJ family, contains REC and HTH domains [Paenibacillus sp. UNCCL117]|uniref:response regulator n=1 Tax=unclassified Paenibacillus TaxID=185978 RepID=UPI00088C2839|nr:MULTISPECIES: response regulator transcription factor [unclassified Paenibacillus]SDE66678.1 DNA-binding response regulator, NarL/FixJ family, contains REC and HTH domains [Paenibacillus sp. cl123]SFW70651.1 DNA-binding response regulator, NarL/FixJ family, contains REC and HTH domains [Paenibacillus sp. UNCCL117]
MKVLIADDHPLYRSGVKNLFRLSDDLYLAGEASNGEEAVELARQLMPDLILMDIRMPGFNGIEATRIIKSRFPQIHILMLSMHKDDHSVFTAMKAGASGYVLKEANELDLLQAIRIVGAGGAVFSPAIAARIISHFSGESKGVDDSFLSELTPREREILDLLALGDTNAQIAARLSLSTKTIANYVTTILNKLQVADRHEARRLIQDNYGHFQLDED